jgi:glyoxylase-like metal-dependent hydrolase (beta-lactamase superfamily II)
MLSLGDVTPLHLADATFPESHPLAGQRGEVFGFVISHPDGLVLVETGVVTGHAGIERAYLPVRRSLDAALRDEGLRVDAVICIVNSHLHFDHCGGNALFPAVPIFIQAMEYEAAHAPGYTVPDWLNLPSPRYKQLQGHTQLLPGIEVVPTRGHTPGHQSVLVTTNDGLVVIAGQAVYSRREYAHILGTNTLLTEDPPPEPESYLASARHLIELEPRRVYFSHDRAVWERPD